MKLLYILLAALLLLPYSIAAQTPIDSIAAQAPKDDVAFDIKDFNKKFETVEWLVEYDNVAWKTTDVLMEQPKSVLERLGKEWFCFQDSDKRWHAVYGKLTGGKYDAAVHFEMDSNGKITVSSKPIDQNFLNKHAVALSTGNSKLMSVIPDGSPRFNQYIRQNTDKTFSVWLLPAFQPNRMAVYGGEAIYTIDQTGTKILKDESYFQKEFRAFRAEPPRDIRLNYSETEKPSLGAIFFIWYYKQYFTKIVVENSVSSSTVVKVDQNYLWIHLEKDKISNPGDERDPPPPKLQRKKPST